MHYPSFLFLLRQIFSWKFIFHLDVKKNSFFILIFGCAGPSIGFSPVAELRLLIVVPSLVAEHGLWGQGLRELPRTGWAFADPRLPGSALGRLGFVAPRHVGSSRVGTKPASPALAATFTAEPPGTHARLQIVWYYCCTVHRFCYF